jgi:uncharacterized protein (TIGR01777 family)
MKVVIAGGTGFLGRPLTASLAADGHDVVVLTRDLSARHSGGPLVGARLVAWTPDGEVGPWRDDLSGAAVVVNLAGESIAGRRWTTAQKQRIAESRVRATRSLVAAIHRVATPPAVFISASAVGYYGPRGSEIVTEEAEAGTDFMARVCVQWEREAARVGGGTRLVCVRSGLVLERDGGALSPMLRPFWFGVGGPVGSGRQFWPWIHRADWIALVRWAIDTSAVAGPLNAAAPEPVTNADFARALGRAMRRPAFMPAPAFALRLLLGEMADGLLLSGQRAVPAKAERLGFQFKYRNLADALASLF